jgi:hypothetical protein
MFTIMINQILSSHPITFADALGGCFIGETLVKALSKMQIAKQWI